jgi:hypothetical protein
MIPKSCRLFGQDHEVEHKAPVFRHGPRAPCDNSARDSRRVARANPFRSIDPRPIEEGMVDETGDTDETTKL